MLTLMAVSRAPQLPTTVTPTTTGTPMTTTTRVSPTTLTATHTATRTVTLMAIRTVGRMKTCTVYICTLWECGFLALTAEINLSSGPKTVNYSRSTRIDWCHRLIPSCPGKGSKLNTNWPNFGHTLKLVRNFRPISLLRLTVGVSFGRVHFIDHFISDIAGTGRTHFAR